MSAFFTITKEEFSNQKTERSDIVDFFKTIKEDFDEMFFMVEDYTPFNQNKLIPLFLNGNKYYFFYGLIENPYTRIKIISNIINDIDTTKHPFFDEYKRNFYDSLLFQTNILKNTVKDKESSKEQEELYVPSQNYFKRYSSLLTSNENSIKLHCKLGCLKSKKKSLIEDCINFRTPYLFHNVFAEINDKTFVILPYFHIEYFAFKLKEIINREDDYKDIWIDIQNQLQGRVQKISSKFFNRNSQVYAILANKQSSENLLEKYNIASCFLIDQNKLLLFKTLNHKENKDFKNTDETYKISQKEILNLNNEILNNEEIGFGLYSFDNYFGVKSENLEIWNILINENISLEQGFLSLDNKGKNEHFIEIGDLEFVFEKFLEYKTDAPLHFLKFLQNDRDLMNSKNRMIITNYTDKIAMYMSGDNYYFKFGKNPDLLTIVPYQGNEFESEYYYQKYQSPVYEVLESKFPHKFNIIEHIENDTYRAVDTELMQLIYLINIPKYPIYIYPPMVISVLPEIDNEFLVIMFPQLFSFYIDKFKSEFLSILTNGNIFPANYNILITSNKALEQKENAIPFLNPLASRINKEPFYFSTKRMQDGTVKTFIIANTNKVDVILELFKPEDNSAERFCIKQLIKSILDYNHNPKAEELSNTFIEKYLPISKKSFSFNQFHTNNPHLDKYSSPIKINSSDIGKVNKLFAQHLAKKKIEPGEYIDDKAKEINGDIFDFLQNLLEKSISDFNEHILIYAYQQLELAEGKREMNSINYGMNTNRAIRYDLKEKVNKEIRDVILQSAYAKHIIHTTLKVNPKGKKHITKSDWTFLLGIVAALMETTQIYEYINYDLSPHKMIISGLYEITTEKISDTINHEKWQDDFVEQQIENSKHSYRKAKEDPNHIVPKKEENIEIDESIYIKKLDALDETFNKECGYSLKNHLNIIYSLYRSNFETSYSFPVFTVSIDEIISYINNVFPEIENREIKEIIKNSSLSFSTYSKDDRLIPTELLRSKKRLNVCPLIKLNNDEYIFGNQLCNFSQKLWWNSIFEGDLPYKESNKSILKDLNEIHKINSTELENETSIYLKKVLGEKFVILNLKKFNVISKDLPKNPPCGEIDVLCVNPNTKTIFVLEAKSILQKNRPYNIKQIFKDFFGTKGKRYYLKLNKKFDFVKNNLPKFIEYFGCKYDNNWKVKKAFVVDKQIFAAYHTEYDVDFLQIKELEKFVNE